MLDLQGITMTRTLLYPSNSSWPFLPAAYQPPATASSLSFSNVTIYTLCSTVSDYLQYMRANAPGSIVVRVSPLSVKPCHTCMPHAVVLVTLCVMFPWHGIITVAFSCTFRAFLLLFYLYQRASNVTTVAVNGTKQIMQHQVLISNYTMETAAGMTVALSMLNLNCDESSDASFLAAHGSASSSASFQEAIATISTLQVNGAIEVKGKIVASFVNGWPIGGYTITK